MTMRKNFTARGYNKTIIQTISNYTDMQLKTCNGESRHSQMYYKTKITIINHIDGPMMMTSFKGSETNRGLPSSVWLKACPGSGIVGIVEWGDNCVEENESCPCPKNSLSQGLAIRRVFAKNSPVLGVVGVTHWTRKQAHLSNEEKDPDSNLKHQPCMRKSYHILLTHGKMWTLNTFLEVKTKI